MATTVLEVVIASQDALAARDLDRYLSFFAENVVVYDPSAPPLEGREALRRFMEVFLSGIVEASFAERKVFPFGRSAAMWFGLRCKTVGGKEGVFEGIDVFELNEQNQIQKITTYYDPASLGALFGG